MGVVNLGNIKHAPIWKVFNGVKHTWTTDEAVGSPVKLDIPFSFSKNKTYLVFIRSYSASVDIEGVSTYVNAISVVTNRLDHNILAGGGVFKPIDVLGGLSFGITLPDYSEEGEPVVYIYRPSVTDAVSLFTVGIYEL